MAQLTTSEAADADTLLGKGAGGVDGRTSGRVLTYSEEALKGPAPAAEWPRTLNEYAVPADRPPTRTWQAGRSSRPERGRCVAEPLK